MSAIAMGPQARTAPAFSVRTQRVQEPSGAAGLHGLTLTRRGRALMVVVAAVVGSLVVLFGGRALADAPGSSQQVVEHQVVSGETLWGIAADAVTPGESVGDAVTELVRLNNLPSSEVMAGQTILVPER
ncbi:LysM peptidoglycan-binding domain-containing protein [Cellulomonas rhizosphaerae]|uniref:LysM peptidoglycan-binding domain-containing protein n=1 Tax=Cellulomonas rhizosphaerae TaxID=2293719 RepID=A0A413RRJ0_9CELL|nr:LysM peptidoglycan-binding domain-containing protein [Cellulomonas rhizosphaerae]RHA44497.1 LysM peptidoglycan-binding domain-containing protein [Cellulomonas rhizosphaerae]